MSNEIDDGGPAFPRLERLHNTDRHMSRDNFTAFSSAGMSLRDWFAGMALQGMVRAALAGEVDDFGHVTMAQFAYDIADAMLQERKGKP